MMTTNLRELLCHAAGALTGLTFTGCGLVPVLAQKPQRRREVVVNGSRVRTVDVHVHCHIARGERTDGAEGAAAVARDVAGAH